MEGDVSAMCSHRGYMIDMLVGIQNDIRHLGGGALISMFFHDEPLAIRFYVPVTRSLKEDWRDASHQQRD